MRPRKRRLLRAPRVSRKAGRLCHVPFLAACVAVPASFTPALAEEFYTAQRNTFGEVGLLEMPSARMAPDGQLSITLSGLVGTQRAVLGFQILPWMEGSFRYSHIVHWSNNEPTYDRSFGLKIRLFQETPYTPDISIGIRDLVGTGIYSSEYLVASKQFWDFDVTAGLGWGRLAANGTFRNPLGLLSPKFDTRSRDTGNGGKFDFNQFFRGPDTGIFGGVAWHTPIDNLNLTLEYSSERYLREHSFGGFPTRSPLNVGLTYAPIQGMSLTAGWFYGSTFGASFTVTLDPTRSAAPVKIDTAPMDAVLRTDAQSAAAVTALVEGAHSRSPRSARAAQPADYLLAQALSTANNVEIDGRMLLVDVHARGRGDNYCAQYAAAAGTTPAAIDSIAVTDLDNAQSNIALCTVHHSADTAQMVRTAALGMDSGVQLAALSAADDADTADVKSIEQQIRDDAAAQKLAIEAVSIGTNELTVYYRNTHYEFETEALGRLVRVLMADAPPSVEIFRLVSVQLGQAMQDVQILRGPLERMYTTRGNSTDIRAAIGLRPAPLSNPILDAGLRGTYPRFYWSISPSLRQGLFDPTSPLRLQLFASIGGGVEIFPGLSLDAQFEANLYNTFVAQQSNSLLPHVRSDIGLYLTKGANGVSALDLSYRTRVAPNLFVEAKAGYLEDMFAGAGGQVLWRPEGGRWAVGADLYEVWQRNFDRLAGLQPYHVLTGHVSVYYQSPWYGLNLNLHAGRYLAGDDGVTLEVTRLFSTTGIEVGAFATFTNVPFSQFGEGSFDKGITVRIPLQWALPFSTQSSYNLTLRPLTRDGGQRLSGDDSLYEETRRTSYEEISRNIEYIANP